MVSKNRSNRNEILENKNNKKPLLDFIPKDERDMTCLTQIDICLSENECYWPQITCYEKLYYENSSSIFILNKRNPNDLLKSFKKWYNFDKRILKYNPELFKKFQQSLNDDEKLLYLFKTHYKNIEVFFSTKPDSKFIIYDIKNDEITKLKKYINIKNIKKFPHENKN